MIISIKNFGEDLRKIRKSTGISQGRLALLAHLGVHTIRRIEKGDNSPRMDTITAIINAITESREYYEKINENIEIELFVKSK